MGPKAPLRPPPQGSRGWAGVGPGLGRGRRGRRGLAYRPAGSDIYVSFTRCYLTFKTLSRRTDMMPFIKQRGKASRQSGRP